MSPPITSSRRRRAGRRWRPMSPAIPPGFAWGFNWYYAIFPQLEQQHDLQRGELLSLADGLQSAHGGRHQGERAALPDRNPRISQLLPGHHRHSTPTTTPSRITSAITADRRRYQPYTGTIVPGYNVEHGMNTVSANNLPVVGMQSITDGTSNTGLFSERLLVRLSVRHRRRHVYPNGTSGSARDLHRGHTRRLRTR